MTAFHYLTVPLLPIGTITTPNGLSRPPRWGRFFSESFLIS